MIIAAAAVSAVACKKAEIQQPITTETETETETSVVRSLFGNIEQLKVTIDSDGSPSWTAYDQIVIIKANTETGVTTTSEVFTCDNPATGHFTNDESKLTVEDGFTYSAFYPASQYNKEAFTWPSTFDAPENAGVWNASYVPMAAKATVTEENLDPLNFHNLAGLFRFNLRAYDPSCQIIIENITLDADQGFSGAYTIVDEQDGQKAKIISGSGDMTVNYNIYYPQAGTSGIDVNNEESRILYIGAPANDYTNLKITFSGKINNNNSGWTSYSRTYTAKKTISVAKSSYTKMSFQKLGETAVTSLELNETAITLDTKNNFRYTLVASVSPSDAPDVEWSTSDKTVASVIDGTVYANAPGKAIITASSGGKKATCVVTVVEPDALSVTFEGESTEDNSPENRIELSVDDLDGEYVAFKVFYEEKGVQPVWTVTPAMDASFVYKSTKKEVRITLNDTIVRQDYDLTFTYNGESKTIYLTVVD